MKQTTTVSKTQPWHVDGPENSVRGLMFEGKFIKWLGPDTHHLVLPLQKVVGNFPLDQIHRNVAFGAVLSADNLATDCKLKVTYSHNAQQCAPTRRSQLCLNQQKQPDVVFHLIQQAIEPVLHKEVRAGPHGDVTSADGWSRIQKTIRSQIWQDLLPWGIYVEPKGISVRVEPSRNVQQVCEMAATAPLKGQAEFALKAQLYQWVGQLHQSGMDGAQIATLLSPLLYGQPVNPMVFHLTHSSNSQPNFIPHQQPSTAQSRTAQSRSMPILPSGLAMPFDPLDSLINQIIANQVDNQVRSTRP